MHFANNLLIQPCQNTPNHTKKKNIQKNSELYQPAKPQPFRALLHHLPTLLKTRIKVLLSGRSEVRILLGTLKAVGLKLFKFCTNGFLFTKSRKNTETRNGFLCNIISRLLCSFATGRLKNVLHKVVTC